MHHPLLTVIFLQNCWRLTLLTAWHTCHSTGLSLWVVEKSADFFHPVLKLRFRHLRKGTKFFKKLPRLKICLPWSWLHRQEEDSGLVWHSHSEHAIHHETMLGFYRSHFLYMYINRYKRSPSTVDSCYTSCILNFCLSP